eukprot:1234206-Amorphochlora_amoeboformis.AAC.1
MAGPVRLLWMVAGLAMVSLGGTMGKNDVAMPRSRGLFRFLGRIGVKTRDFGHRTKFEGRGFAKHGRYSAGRATNLVVAASKKPYSNIPPPFTNVEPQDASPSTTSDEVEGVSIGIDLGTTNSLVAYVDPDTNEPEILPVTENSISSHFLAPPK